MRVAADARNPWHPQRRSFRPIAQGSGFVHCGRGEHLDNDALLAALKTGQLSSVMLDVTDPEPLPKAHPFGVHPGVILTPHVATETNFEEGAVFCAQAIQAHLKGAAIAGLVSKDHRY